MVYCSNHKLACLAWMILEGVLLPCWSSIDGEYYAGDQEYYCDNPKQQEQYEQGKYNIGNSLLSYSPFN
jgi:hypothetical protein